MKKFCTIALLSLVTGCSTAHIGKFNSSDGWRVGEIIETGANNKPLPIAGIDCRDKISDAGLRTSQVAYVQIEFGSIAGKYFYSGPKQRHAIVFIPDNETFKEGDLVYINILSCRMPIAHLSGAS